MATEEPPEPQPQHATNRDMLVYGIAVAAAAFVSLLLVVAVSMLKR